MSIAGTPLRKITLQPLWRKKACLRGNKDKEIMHYSSKEDTEDYWEEARSLGETTKQKGFTTAGHPGEAGERLICWKS